MVMRDRNIRILFIALILFPTLNMFIPLRAFAGPVPYRAWTRNPDGTLAPTQIPFMPIGKMEAGFNAPEDIFIDSEGYIYIADTGNGRIVVFDGDGFLVREVGKGSLKKPTGVFVDGEGHIYVADYDNRAVFIFDEAGGKLDVFERPQSPLYGKKSAFKPKKLVVDKRGNIYVISEGSTNGVVQLNNAGEFLGYFGVNQTRVSLKMIMQRIFFTEEQIGKLFKVLPPSPDNIAIDHKSIIYTDTRGEGGQNIKKLNIAGHNMLDRDKKFFPRDTAITVDGDGNIFTVDDRGYIYEYDSYGNLLFMFSGKDVGDQRLGLLKEPSGVAIDEDGMLYVLDKGRDSVILYEPTEFANEVHRGISLYREGLYVDSQEHWEKVLSMNSNFAMAHQAMGKAYFKQQQYDEALESFRYVKNKKEYSETFWEIRQRFMQAHLGTILLIILIFIIVKRILRIVDKKHNIFGGVRRWWKRVRGVDLVSETLYLNRFFKHPIDSFYELRWMGKVSVASATLLYVVLVVEKIIKLGYTGFIFSDVDIMDISLGREIVKFIIPIGLWIVSNYLISTINDGEGRFRDIYTGTVYSLAPFIVFSIPLTLLSNILTLNEGFLYSFFNNLVVVWSGVLLFLMVKEVHNLSVKETIKNILLTLFGMVIMVLVAFVLYLVLGQLNDFIYSVVQEVKSRV